MAAPAIQRPSAKWIVLGSWQWVVSYRQSTGLKWAGLQGSDTGIWDRRSVFSCWMHMMWQKVWLHAHSPLWWAWSCRGSSLCFPHQCELPALGTGWQGLARQRWEADSGIPFQCHDNQFKSNNGAKGVFFGVHLSLFNWLPFIEFAIWFVFPLTAQLRAAPALKAHHLLPRFKWMILLLRGIRKMLDELLENRECQLCVLFLFECLDFKIYYCFTIYSTILIPKLPKRLSNSDSGDSSHAL